MALMGFTGSIKMVSDSLFESNIGFIIKNGKLSATHHSFTCMASILFHFMNGFLLLFWKDLSVLYIL